MPRIRAVVALLVMLLAAPLHAAPPERLQFDGASYRLAWASEESNDYQPDDEAGRGAWHRMISIRRVPEVHDAAGLRAAMAKFAARYAQRGTVIAQTCHDATAGRPAECSTLARDAVQDTRDGLFVVTAVHRFVLHHGRAVHAMLGWRTYGMDGIDRDRAFVESAAGRARIRAALAWPVPFDAAPVPLTRSQKADARDAFLRAVGECRPTRGGRCG